mmetsp:Transcript_20330/g.40684  ORF Transcript_20330/g.40684 Transcript_20330/m.40684 type:complete len:83 (-) Transcript_20330:24-272(-)
MDAGLMTGSPRSLCMEGRPEVGLKDGLSSMAEGLCWLAEEELEGRCTALGGRGGAAGGGRCSRLGFPSFCCCDMLHGSSSRW